MDYVLSPHAKEKVRRRQIPLDLLEAVLNNPEQVVEESRGRKAYQSKIVSDGQEYLVRVIVDDKVDPVVVVTVYKTNKIRKYWRQR